MGGRTTGALSTWVPALDAAGLDPGLTPYAMRHTYASFALDAGVTIFELARLMGTSVKVIDETYGHLVRGSFDRVRFALGRAGSARRSCRGRNDVWRHDMSAPRNGMLRNSGRIDRCNHRGSADAATLERYAVEL
jgi:hypothetical protein